MTEKTKACNLTAEEIECLLGFHGRNLDNNSAVIKYDKSDIMERIKYLSTRLKAFSELEVAKSEPNAAGWSSNNG